MERLIRILTVLTLFSLPYITYAGGYTMTPDGGYVGGDSYQMTPDGGYVGGDSYQMTPDGGYVGDY